MMPNIMFPVILHKVTREIKCSKVINEFLQFKQPALIHSKTTKAHFMFCNVCPSNFYLKDVRLNEDIFSC